MNNIRLPLIVTLMAAGVVFYGLTQAALIQDNLSRWTIREVIHIFLYVATIGIVFSISLKTSMPKLWFISATLIWVIYLFGVGATVSVALLFLVSVTLGSKCLSVAKIGGYCGELYALSAVVGYAVLLGIFQFTIFFNINTDGLVLIIATLVLLLNRSRVLQIFHDVQCFIVMPVKHELSCYLLVIPISLAMILLIYASYPESHSDALVAHLMIPHQVMVHGHWSFDAANFIFAVMPKGASWLYGAHYLLGGELAVRLANFIMIMLMSWIIYLKVSSYADRIAASLLVAVFLSTPLTSWLVFVVFEDGLMALFVLSAAVILVNNWKSPNAGVVFIISLLLSAAVATKIQALYLALPITLILLGCIICRKAIDIKGMVLAFAPVALIAIVPYVTALVITGNPVFPFFNEVFRSPLYPPENFYDGRWAGELTYRFLYDLTFESSRFMEGANGSFGIGVMVLVPGLIFALIKFRHAPIALLMLIAISFTLLITQFTLYARYLYIIFPLLTISYSLLYMASVKEGWKIILILIFIIIIVVNVSGTRSLNAFYQFILPNPLSSQKVLQPSPVSERYFNSIINSEYGGASRVLYMVRPYGAMLDGMPLYTSWHNPNLRNAISNVENEIDAVNLIKEWQITHIISGPSNYMDPRHLEFAKWIPQLGRLESKSGDSILWFVEKHLALVGEKISTNNLATNNVLGLGWLPPEIWGSWAVGDSAELSFRLVGRSKSLGVYIVGNAMSHTDNLVVRVYINGSLIPVEKLYFNKAHVAQEWRVFVPKMILGHSNSLSIVFEFEKSVECEGGCDGGNQLRLGLFDFRVVNEE